MEPPGRPQGEYRSTQCGGCPVSELHLGLLGIGALVVVGVLVYNKLQEGRLKRAADETFGSRHADVLLGGDNPAGQAGTDAAVRKEPTLAPAQSSAAADSGSLDQRIDFIATLQSAQAIKGETISGAIVDSLEAPSRAVTWEGYNRQAAGWEPLAASGEYEKLRAGLQLVDRKGAAILQDLSAFSVTIQGIAAAIGTDCILAETGPALERARELDGFCADIDVQIGLNLIARGGPFAGTRIRALAEAHGMSLEGDGKYCRRDETGLELYSLCNMETAAFSRDGMKEFSTGGLTLLFDVPRAPGGIETFDRFVEFARAQAEALSASIVDDNRQALDVAALGKIRAQLQGLYASMEQQGIAAGSELALRLFS